MPLSLTQLECNKENLMNGEIYKAIKKPKRGDIS